MSFFNRIVPLPYAPRYRFRVAQSSSFSSSSSTPYPESNGCITRAGWRGRREESRSHERERQSPLSSSSPSPSSTPAWLLAAGRSPAEFHRRHVSLWFMRLARGKTTNPPSPPPSHFCSREYFIRRNYLYALPLFQFYLSYFFFFFIFPCIIRCVQS